MLSGRACDIISGTKIITVSRDIFCFSRQGNCVEGFKNYLRSILIELGQIDGRFVAKLQLDQVYEPSSHENNLVRFFIDLLLLLNIWYGLYLDDIVMGGPWCGP